jgi:hypothetical protein
LYSFAAVRRVERSVDTDVDITNVSQDSREEEIDKATVKLSLGHESTFLSLFEHNANLQHSQTWINPPRDIQFVGFHRSREGYTIGTNNSMYTLRIDPFHADLRPSGKDLLTAVNTVSSRCEVIAIIGAGKNPAHPANHVYVWDTNSKTVSEIVCESVVRSIDMRLNR